MLPESTLSLDQIATAAAIATCRFCGHDIEPCANCGGADGFMVRAHSGAWIHKDRNDCIMYLRGLLRDAERRIAELEQAAATRKK